MAERTVVKSKNSTSGGGLEWLTEEEKRIGEEGMADEGIAKEAKVEDFETDADEMSAEEQAVQFSREVCVLRRTMSEQNREDLTLSKRFAGLINFTDGWYYRFGVTLEGLGPLRKIGQNIIDGELEKNPSSLRGILSNRKTLLTDKIKTIGEFLDKINSSVGRLTEHYEYTIKEYETCTSEKEKAQLDLVAKTEEYDAARLEYEDLKNRVEAQERRLKAGEEISEADFLSEVVVKEASRNEQDLAMQMNSLKHDILVCNTRRFAAEANENKTRLAIHQLNTLYEQIDIQKIQFQALMDLHFPVMEEQVDGLVLAETAGQFTQDYIQTAQAADEVSRLVSEGLEAHMALVIENYTQPFVKKESLIRDIEGVRRTREMIDRYHVVLEDATKNAGEYFEEPRKMLRELEQMNREVKKLKVPDEKNIDKYLEE